MGYRAIIAGGGTGGHLYPALNLGEALGRCTRSDLEITFVGARRGVEARVFPERGVRYRLLSLEPIYRSRIWRNWRLGPAAVRTGLELFRLFDSVAPDMVLGTGGYAAGPVVAWAAARGIPTALQEQNSYPGITTRWLAPYVDQLHLGYGEAMRHLWPGPDTVVRTYGNPIHWPARRPNPDEARREFGLGAGPVVLIVGGSQGAGPLNEVMLRAIAGAAVGELPPLPSDTEVLWATGPAHHRAVTTRLAGLAGQIAIRTTPYIGEMEKALAVTTLAVSRAGALALSEFCAWGVPALLVPLPHAAADHQLRNARSLEALGAATVFEQAEVSSRPAVLWHAIVETLGDAPRLQAMRRAAEARGNPHAAEEIAADLRQLIEAR